MNKYLLLRDNKQSGPYTVPEIIALGIKPYDLVWLEGKSAAWRYPSEVEDLKAYAPTVEEQPFDRFYKKPTPVESAEPEEKKAEQAQVNHQRYQPKIERVPEEIQPAKKVYINFPASTTANTPVQSTSVIKADVVLKTTTTNHSNSKSDFPTSEPVDSPREKDMVSERWQQMKEPVAAKPKSNKNFYVAVTACILLGIVSGILLFNFYRQRETLKELSLAVQKMELDKKQQQASQVALAQETPALLPPSSVIESNTPEMANVEEPVMPQTEEKIPAARSSVNSGKKKNVSTEASATVIFSENNAADKTGRPVERREDEPEANKSSNSTPDENLFKLVEVKPNEYKTGLLGGISNLKFEIINNSSKELQRVAVEVKYLGPEKKVVKKHTVYFENVSPGGQTTIDVPKSNRGVSIEYTVTDIKS